MKILHVTKKYPPALGGDAVVVSHLRKYQDTAGHSTVVVTSRLDSVPREKNIYTFGLKDVPAKLDMITLRRLISLVFLSVKMLFILRKERPNVVHTHSIDMAFVVSFAARLCRIPLVHTFHIVTFYDENQSFLRRKTELWLARHAHLARITAPNMFDVEKLRAAGLTQTVLLPNGVDIDFWEVTSKQENEADFLFLAVGRLEKQKGYDYLLKAVSLLSCTTPLAFRVWIVGEGAEKRALQMLARDLQITRLVTFAGCKKSEEIRALLSRADAAVFASLYETTPLTLLEAWAAKVPVIATPVGILRGIPAKEAACHIVPIKDEYALMQAMKYFIEHPSKGWDMAGYAYEKVQEFAWPHVAQVADKMYRSLA